MKQVCLLCERTSSDGNLYCQEPYCPAEMSPTILDSGDWCGDIEITRRIIVLRSAVLYEAVRQKEKVFLKVAHPGPENKERLKREAEFLGLLQQKREHQRTLPLLLPPYTGTTIVYSPYGKTMLGGHLLYFYLFEPFDGEPLRDVLAKNPQLWINHVGWLVTDLAATVNFLHGKGLLHLGLSPECVLVRFDEKANVPRILLFDLGLASGDQNVAQASFPTFVPPAYTAPELARDGRMMRQVDYRTDVFGVGLVLYEMLVGKPVFPYKLLSDAQVYQIVSEDRRTPMNRVEDVRKVAEVAMMAVSQDPAQRQPDAYTVMSQLTQLFGRVPQEKKPFRISLNTLFLVIGILMIIAFLLAVALSLSNSATAQLGSPTRSFASLSIVPVTPAAIRAVWEGMVRGMCV